MVKNKHIQVVNENGTTVILSGAILVEYLKDYTSDWGSISTSATIAEIESEFSPSALEDPTNKANMDTFNSKIGFVLPKITLDSLINEVIILLREENIDYLTLFQSFNNLEKVAVYFILMIQNNRTVGEIFQMISSNYKDLSKRDIMIRLLSEVEVIESQVDITDPINGLFKLMATTRTHNTKPEPVYDFGGGSIEFKDFSFPMHSYNVTKRFGGLGYLNENNDSVRNYFDRFKDTWTANYNTALRSNWFAANSPLYKNIHWKSVIKDDVMSTISGPESEKHKVIKNYRYLLDEISYKEININTSDEKPLFKYIGENFFDFNPNSNTTDDQASRSPLTMTKYTSSTSATNGYFNRDNLTTGLISYNSSNFKNLKTVLSYYMSDLNMWFTSDDNLTNTAYADYLHTQTSTRFLPSGTKSETKGYFSNIMFMQSAIQRVLFPKILRVAQNAYGGKYSLDSVFEIDENIYDTIFDSIVNNAFVFTDRNSASTDFEANYEIIPNRAILETTDLTYDLNNYKATNLYEFLINSMVHSQDDVFGGNSRKILNFGMLSSYTRQDLLYKQNAINYNPLSNQLSTTPTSLTLSDFGSDQITYNFGTNYNPTSSDNWIDKIFDTFFKTDVDSDSYSKINYRDVKFFKLPVHSSTADIRNTLNRRIKRTDRELLTDITDMANFDIKGLALADFTYGERALLKEYLDNFRSIKKLGVRDYTDLQVVEEMISDLDDLIAWKNNPSDVAINDPDNVYYRISALANPFPSRPNSSNIDYYRWQAEIASLKKTVYFPEILSIFNIGEIKEFLNRAIVKINGNRNSPRDMNFVMQAKALVQKSAIDIPWVNTGRYSNNDKLTLNTISTNFLSALKNIISHIKETNEYATQFDTFTTTYQSGIWADIVTSVNLLRSVLLNDTLIEEAIINSGMYTGYESGILKDLDMGLYKVIINNYFSYLVNPAANAAANLKNIVLVDNNNTGFIKYYSDILTLLKFVEKYHELVPKYIEHLDRNVLGKYYKLIDAIKTLPSWDYESLHRRDLESDLKQSGGVNSHDYNITWGNGSRNIVMIYRRPDSFSFSYRVTPRLYMGGLSNTISDNMHRDRWWRRWLQENGEAFSYENINAFKVPDVNITDNNIPFPTTWKYNDPTPTVKSENFFKMKTNSQTYQSGLVANISSFKYITDTKDVYKNIGVPLLLLGDVGSEWDKANTTRVESFSFETDFLKLWYTDEGYDDGLDHNDGGGEAYTWAYQLVSGADRFKNFGLGKMDIQALFRHFWNMESSVMGTPYNLMAYYIFDTWDDGYDYKVGNFPYSTVVDYGSPLSTKDTRKKSNIYDFKFVLQNSFLEGKWSPVRLSGEDRSFGVDPSITNDQIFDNFYLTSRKSFISNRRLRDGIFDIYNRNFRNRIYFSYLRWRQLFNEGEW